MAHKFTLVAGGYDSNQVDGFLDKAEAELLDKKSNTHLLESAVRKARAAALRAVIEGEKEAARIIAEAEEEAAKIREAAHEDAAELVEDAIKSIEASKCPGGTMDDFINQLKAIKATVE